MPHHSLAGVPSSWLLLQLAVILALTSGLGEVARAQCADCDGDGYSWPLDCNDADPDIHPNAPDTCNGLDDDCDGDLDGPPTCARACSSPGGVLPPLQLSDIGAPGRTSVVWTGESLGIVFSQMQSTGLYQVVFTLVDGSGQVLVPPTPISDSTKDAVTPGIAWSGSEFGVVWMDHRYNPPAIHIFFRRVSPAGSVLGDSRQITAPESNGYDPRIRWTGRAFATMWIDPTAVTLYLAEWDPLGNIVNGPWPLQSFNSYPQEFALAATPSGYGIVWTVPDATVRRLIFARLDQLGILLAPPVQIDQGTHGVSSPSIVWTGQEYAVTWSSSDYPEQVYFQAITASGVTSGSNVQITGGAPRHVFPSLAWSGAELGLVYVARDNSVSSVRFSRLTSEGASLGSEITLVESQDTIQLPQLVWTGEVYAIAYEDSTPVYHQVLRYVGCTCNVDRDSDGYSVCPDCDDSDPTVNPSRAEICNGIDDNCNGLIDEDPTNLDSDSDGIPNACDNCLFVINTTQTDSDRDGVGNSCDNCLTVANAGQTDFDADGQGDACDNCVNDYNPLQGDLDLDSVGDACDNCLFVPNPGQADLDQDSFGDVCDNDIDGDGIPNEADLCPSGYDPTNSDTDGDDLGDACEACPLDPQNDTDNDGICANLDNCPNIANPDQGDCNGDSVGDVCDLNDGLILVMLPDALTVGWHQEAGFDSFNVYRGNLTALIDTDDNGAAENYGTCLARGVFGTSFTDSTTPAIGTGYIYLITGRNAAGENSLGTASSGAPRPNANACPGQMSATITIDPVTADPAVFFRQSVTDVPGDDVVLVDVMLQSSAPRSFNGFTLEVLFGPSVLQIETIDLAATPLGTCGGSGPCDPICANNLGPGGANPANASGDLLVGVVSRPSCPPYTGTGVIGLMTIRFIAVNGGTTAITLVDGPVQGDCEILTNNGDSLGIPCYSGNATVVAIH